MHVLKNVMKWILKYPQYESRQQFTNVCSTSLNCKMAWQELLPAPHVDGRCRSRYLQTPSAEDWPACFRPPDFTGHRCFINYLMTSLPDSRCYSPGSWGLPLSITVQRSPCNQPPLVGSMFSTEALKDEGLISPKLVLMCLLCPFLSFQLYDDSLLWCLRPQHNISLGAGVYNLLWKLELLSKVSSHFPVLCRTKDLRKLMKRGPLFWALGPFCFLSAPCLSASCTSMWSWCHLDLPLVRLARQDERMCSRFAGLLHRAHLPWTPSHWDDEITWIR